MKFRRTIRLMLGAAIGIAMLALGTHAARLAKLSAKDSRIAFAVLGDSDSHSFHDSVMLTDPKWRGAEFRNVTYQWTEIIARLRSDQIDMGEWGIWGAPGRVAQLVGFFGFEDRAPRKQDYRFNFAISGAKCNGLTEGMSRQVQRLLYLMDLAPTRWQNGIISIRIGINSIGTHQALVDFAAHGVSEQNRQQVAECTNYIAEAVRLIREKHKTTRILLVGILSNADYIPELSRWRSGEEIHNIDAVLDIFDNTLREMADRDPNILFWDDRAWFRKYFGSRDDSGLPNYRDVCLESVPVHYTLGNAPDNAVLGDGHAGTVWNGLWAKDVLRELNQRFGYRFTPIQESDIARLAGFSPVDSSKVTASNCR